MFKDVVSECSMDIQQHLFRDDGCDIQLMSSDPEDLLKDMARLFRESKSSDIIGNLWENALGLLSRV